MSINRRIQAIIDDLFYGNQRAFSRAIGVTPSVTGNIVGKRQSIPSAEFLERVANSIKDINGEWILTGKESMLKTKEALNSNSQIVSEESIQYGHANIPRPFIESDYSEPDKACRFSEIIKDADFRKLSLPLIGYYDFSLQAHGDSMVNRKERSKSIYDKAIVACRFWDSNSHIRWGEVYALATTKGIIIKKILPSVQADHVKCISFNEEEGYHAYDLPISDILEWSIVTGVVSVSVW